MQQGDNGQSIVLGGMTPETDVDGYNLLSEMCLRASAELRADRPEDQPARAQRASPLDSL